MNAEDITSLMATRGYCYYVEVSKGVDVLLVYTHMERSCLTATVRWNSSDQIEVKLKAWLDGLLLQSPWVELSDGELFRSYEAKIERILRTLGYWT